MMDVSGMLPAILCAMCCSLTLALGQVSLIHWRLEDPHALSWKMVFFFNVTLAACGGIVWGAAALFAALTSPHEYEVLRLFSVACAGMMCVLPYMPILPVFMLDGDVDISWTAFFTPFSLLAFVAGLIFVLGCIFALSTGLLRKAVMFFVASGNGGAPDFSMSG